MLDLTSPPPLMSYLLSFPIFFMSVRYAGDFFRFLHSVDYISRLARRSTHGKSTRRRSTRGDRHRWAWHDRDMQVWNSRMTLTFGNLSLSQSSFFTLVVNRFLHIYHIDKRTHFSYIPFHFDLDTFSYVCVVVGSL